MGWPLTSLKYQVRGGKPVGTVSMAALIIAVRGFRCLGSRTHGCIADGSGPQPRL
jgi:hypothetical protein